MAGKIFQNQTVKMKQIMMNKRLYSTDKVSGVRFGRMPLYFGGIMGLYGLFCYGYGKYYELPVSRYMFIQPILYQLDGETSHELAVKAAQYPKMIRGILGMNYNSNGKSTKLETNVFGLGFKNCVGLAAGFDKNGETVDGMFDIGFGFIEIGSITPKPQDGNPKPRVFRLLKDKAVINRYGFNSDGHKIVKERLKTRINSGMYDINKGILGINLGKNKTTAQENSVDDYKQGIKEFITYCDYLVINVSSPNTPGLRNLQKQQILYNLLNDLKEYRDIEWENQKNNCIWKREHKIKPPLLVKVAPDLNDNEINDISTVIKSVGIDGIIVGNTTIDRDVNRLNLKSNIELINQKGGLSGKCLFNKSNIILKKFYKQIGGNVPIIGVGGISSVNDVYTKIKCGASLVQLYTGLIFNGPSMIHDILNELNDLAIKDGYNNIYDAIGVDV